MSRPRPIRTGEPIEAWLLLLAAVLVALIGLSSTAAAEEVDPDVEAVELAVLHVINHGIPAHRIAPWPKHPLARDDDSRREFAEAVVDAGRAHNVDPWLLVAIGFRENSFGVGGVGALGEVSAFQLVPSTVDFVRLNLDTACDASTVRGAARCAAALLDHWRDRCRGLRGALVLYATGRTCVADTEHLRWLVRDRFGIARILSE